MRLFLTGNPGIGKTTLIRAVLDRLEDVACAGFYTEEKRHGGQRIGFKIITLEGQEGTLASIGRKKPMVGRYSVHVSEFEELVLSHLDPAVTPADLYVIDEIGKMELLSHKFRTAIVDLLAQPSNLLATIAKKGKGFIEQIKRRNDIELIEVTAKNRDDLREHISQKIKAELGGS
jgi:nucleoside-triphosphatase